MFQEDLRHNRSASVLLLHMLELTEWHKRLLFLSSDVTHITFMYVYRVSTWIGVLVLG